MLTESGPTIYEQIGGEPTITHTMGILFDDIVPRSEKLVTVFGERSTDPRLRAIHTKAVGQAVGRLLGNPDREPLDVAQIAAYHHNPISKDVFDSTIGGIVTAFNRAGEELEQPTHLAVEALAALVPDLEAALVSPDQP